jgi:hypothetical protein
MIVFMLRLRFITVMYHNFGVITQSLKQLLGYTQGVFFQRQTVSQSLSHAESVASNKDLQNFFLLAAGADSAPSDRCNMRKI